MKNKLLLLATSVILVGLSGCGDKGSGGGQNVSIPGLPQGRVSVVNYNGTTDSSNYCDVAQDQKSMICTSLAQGMNGQTTSCQSQQITYVDKVSMCQGLISALNNVANTCGRTAIQYMYNSQQCSTVVQNGNVGNGSVPPIIGGGTLPNQNQTNGRAIQCSYEAARVTGGRFIRGYLAEPLTSVLLFEGHESAALRITNILELSHYGNIRVSYDKNADRVSIANQGLFKRTDVTQSGFAGQEVRYEVNSDDNDIRLVVSCKDIAQTRVINTDANSYSCKIRRGGDDAFEKTFDIDDILNGEVQVARGIKLSAITVTGLNSALITLSSELADGNTVLSSAYLNSTTQLKLKDGGRAIEINCRPKR